jgi:hypothetical protein
VPIADIKRTSGRAQQAWWLSQSALRHDYSAAVETPLAKRPFALIDPECGARGVIRDTRASGASRFL